MRNVSRTLFVGVVIASALAAMPSGRALALPPAGPGVPIWAPDWMKNGSGHTAWDPGRTLALRQARTFDLILAHATTYDNHVSAMMSANRNLRLFVYVQGMFSPAGNLPARWYARTAAGNRIRSLEFGTYLMNPRSGGWRNEVLSNCRARLSASHYHGCFLDSLGPTGVGEFMSGTPVDPETGRAYTRRHWLEATKALAVGVEAAMAPRPTLLNGLVDGPGYVHEAGPTERLLDGCTGGMMEAFVRGARWKVSDHKTVSAWREDVDALVDAGTRGEGAIVLAITKVWTSATPGQVARLHRYSLGTFLLGYKPGHAYFSFRSDHDLTTPSALWGAGLGAPGGSYVRTSSGLFVRAFGGGLVVVNPTTSSHSLRLGRRYVDLDGVTRASGTNLVLSPHTAQILRNA